jgi:hypothetical protein
MLRHSSYRNNALGHAITTIIQTDTGGATNMAFIVATARSIKNNNECPTAMTPIKQGSG